MRLNSKMQAMLVVMLFSVIALCIFRMQKVQPRHQLIIEDESTALQLKNQLNKCEVKLAEAEHWLKYCVQQVEGCVTK
jgi:hypothetical protein